MRRTNRVESINDKPNELARGVMTITTQVEIIRRIEIIPINEAVGHVRISPTIRRDVHYGAASKRSRKILGLIACLFITAGLLALSIMISGLIIAFRSMKVSREGNIERYDLGDLRYGINDANQLNFPSNIHLSNVNKMFIQKYLSDQLLHEPGYHGLVIDGVSVQDQITTNRRKQRDTSCSIMFIIQNIQVYFDQCSTCVNERNLILRRSFSNIITFRELFDLLLNDFKIITQICSIPNIPHLIVPAQLNTSSTQKINSSQFSTTTNFRYISSTIPFKRTLIDTPSSTVNFEEPTSHFTTELDSSQAISTIETQTSDYIKQTTRSPIFIPLSTKLTTTHRQSTVKSSITTKLSLPKTIPSMFQFLPFKPSTTILPWRSTSSNYNPKTNSNRSRTSNIN